MVCLNAEQSRVPDDLLFIVVVKGQGAAEEKVGDDPETPDVDGLVVGPLKEDLRSDVGQSAKGLGALLVGSDHLGEAEVDDLDVAVFGLVDHEDVFRLEITMGDAVAMEVEEGGG